MVGEITDRSNQDTAFSMMNVSYRLGQIIGLPLGGLLAHPERRWKAFQTPFWHEYPFILPCFVGAGFSLISVLFGILFVQEVSYERTRSGFDSQIMIRLFRPKSNPDANSSGHRAAAARPLHQQAKLLRSSSMNPNSRRTGRVKNQHGAQS
jgi:MFS family permease